MLFELRDSKPVVSPPWYEIRDQFLAGRARDAWQAACTLRGSKLLTTANDYLLNIEIARACSANRTYLALVHLAEKRFPHSPIVQLYQARLFLTRNMHRQGIEYLMRLESTLGDTHPSEWTAELASIFANGGFDASCRQWLARYQKQDYQGSALSLYTISCAHEGMQRWDEAIEFSMLCVVAAPDWSRARSHLVNCLLTQGRIDEAKQALEEGQDLGHEESVLDMTSAMLAFSIGEFDEAEASFRALLTNWPQADFVNWVRRTLCVLLVELGRTDEAREIAAGNEERFALPDLSDCLTNKPHHFIPLPLVAQHKNQCVPTSMAMAAYPQGKTLDPKQLFIEMKGRDGIPLWRMREWLSTNGFQLVPVKLEHAALFELLEASIPLMGVMENPFNSHVEIICGYNQAIDVYYIRDPMHWAPIAMPFEMTFHRYHSHGAVLAIVDENSPEILEVANRYKSEECDAVIDLAQAVAEGNLTEADRAYAQISDESPLAYIRDGQAFSVAITPIKFQQRMKLYANSEASAGVTRFRALMWLNIADAEEAIQHLLAEDSLKLGITGERYIKLLNCMHHGKWQDAQALIEKLLIFGSSTSNFWELKAEILAELGDQIGSLAAMDLAVELDPHRMSLREKALNLSATNMTFAEYLQEFETLLQDDPDNKSLLWGKAIAYLDGPDGKAFEQAAQEYLRWFPRDPRGYTNLAAWYRQQTRNDRADTLEQTAKSLLDEDYEDTTPQQTDQTQAMVEDENTEDKEVLLQLLGRYGHPQKEFLRQRLLLLEQEGKLLWHERAQLMALRLTFDIEPTNNGELDANTLLPNPTPGAPHWYANYLVELVDQNNPTRKLANQVVEWIERVVPDYRMYPGLWFNRVVLMEKTKHLERAAKELSDFLEQYPRYSSAIYRMGVVKHDQNNLQESVSLFEEALDINPGLYGAMYMLRVVHDSLGNFANALEANHRLRQKFPYEFSLFKDQILAEAKHEPADDIDKKVRSESADYCPQRIEVLRAQLKLDNNQLDEAHSMLASLEIGADASDELQEDFLQIRLNLATLQNESSRIAELCDEGLSRWPDSTRLKELKAEQLATSDLPKSLELLEGVLYTGEPTAQTAYQYLSTAQKSPELAAQSVINNADLDRQLLLTEQFAEVFGYQNLQNYCGRFLKWALNKFPDSDNLLYRTVVFYNSHGQTKQAIKSARELFNRNPDHPESARMLGRCLMDKNPNDALPYLEKACEQDRSADNLFELARGYHTSGQQARAIDLHWEVLKLHPLATASLASLYILGVRPWKLWPYVNSMLENGGGIDDQYFLVAAVEIAKDQDEQLSSHWISLAAERWEMLKSYPGFKDEKLKIQRAIAAWLIVEPTAKTRHPNLPNGFITRLEARFYWPKCKWIPHTS